jgi:hypothetical protein
LNGGPLSASLLNLPHASRDQPRQFLLDRAFRLGYYLSIGISSLTIRRIPTLEQGCSRDANSLFRNILRISPYSSKILVVVWP